MRSSKLARTLLLMVTATSAMAAPIAVGALQATPRVQQRQTALRLAFEVASIKPSGPNSPPTSISSSPGRFTTSATSLRRLVTWAYDVGDDRLVGAPDWLDSSRFDISATVPPKEQDEEPVRERLKVMMQSLLADRFRLVSHRETRELPIYALLVDRSGPKIQLRDAGADLGRNTFGMPGSGHLVGTKVTTRMLAKVLSEQLNRSVDDVTRLEGIFDFTLEWAPETDVANASGRPSIFTAIREQLGLRLEARRGPVEVLVIDGIERVPTEN
jgi:uncharacterized protein (TIGR03435 family)